MINNINEKFNHMSQEKRYLLALIFLTLTAFIAHFLYFQSFGIYEDDFFFIGKGMSSNYSELMLYISDCFTKWPQGRPISFSLPALLSYLSLSMGGLSTIYLFGFFITALNAFLCYILLKKIYPEAEIFALVGSLVLCLYPPDTTKIILTNLFMLQPSLTFLLLASICYLYERKSLSYLMILGSLLSYESAFMVFLAIPLFKYKWNKELLKELCRHALILISFVLLIVIIRKFTLDDRISDVFNYSAQIYVIPFKIISGMVLGSLMTLTLFFYGPFGFIKNYNIEILILVVIFAIIFFIILSITDKNTDLNAKNNYPLSIKNKIFNFAGNLDISPEMIKIFKIMLIGFILTYLGYSLSFTHYPPFAFVGRGTSVHFAATLGGSIVFASLALMAINILKEFRLKQVVVIIISVYLALLTGYQIVIQKDFQKSWEYQKDFWTKVVKECPDMQEETMIFVKDKEKLPETKFITTNSWHPPILLEQIYKFPDTWKTPPRLWVVNENWESEIQVKDNQLRWKVPTATWWSHYKTLPQGNVIVLDVVGGKLQRVTDPLQVKNQLLVLKTDNQENLTTRYKKGYLYNYIINKKKL